MLAHGSGWLPAAIVGLLINMRLGAFATSMHPDWRSAPARLRVAVAVMLTDAPWVVARNRTRGRQRYYLGAAVTLFILWPLMVSVGVRFGGRIDAAPVTALLLPLTLGALVVRSCASGQRPRRWWPLLAAPPSRCTCPPGSLALAGLVGAAAAVITERVS